MIWGYIFLNETFHWMLLNDILLMMNQHQTWWWMFVVNALTSVSWQWRHNKWRRLKSPTTRLFTRPFIQGTDQRKHQIPASLAFVRGIHRWPVNSQHKWPVTRKMFPFDAVIMVILVFIIQRRHTIWYRVQHFTSVVHDNDDMCICFVVLFSI